MRFLSLEKLINLHDGYRQTIRIDALEVLMIQEAGQIHIIQSTCPHRGQRLEGGTVEDKVIYCPWHNFGFDLASGAHVGGVCDKLKVYAPIYENNVVGIMTDD